MIGLILSLKGASRLLNKLKSAEKEFPRFMQAELLKMLLAILRETKKNLTGGHPLHVVENRLRSSIIHQITKRGGSFGERVYEGSVGTDVFYGAVHETGKTIYAKKDFMRFWYKGIFYKARKVVIPKREWLTPAFVNAQKKAKAEWDRNITRFIRMREL